MTTYAIAAHKDGFKIIAAWTEQRDVSAKTRHAFRAVAQTSVVYYCKTIAEAEREVFRLQARKRAA